jgi:hypothetical protein
MANIKRANTSGITKSGVAIPDVPDAPTIGAASNVGTSRAYNNGSATVAFTAAATGGTPASYTATSTPGSFTASGAGSPLTVTGLQSATSYTFAVTATNATATGPASSASSSITATTVPAAPTIGTPTVASGQAYSGSAAVSVPFTAPATGGAAISSYTVTSSSGNTGTGSSSPISVTDTVSTARTYTVTATNTNGTSTASSASASTTPASVPQAPTVGTATTTNSTTVSLTFTAGATGGSAITSYTVTSSPSISLSTSGTSSPLTVTGTFVSGTAYTFTITATNAQGTSSSSSASNSITPNPLIGAIQAWTTGGSVYNVNSNNSWQYFTAGPVQGNDGDPVRSWRFVAGGGYSGGQYLGQHAMPADNTFTGTMGASNNSAWNVTKGSGQQMVWSMNYNGYAYSLSPGSGSSTTFLQWTPWADGSTTRAQYPSGRDRLNLTSTINGIYGFGGGNTGGTPVSTNYRWISSNNTWTSLTAVPAAVSANGVAGGGGYCMSVGGNTSNNVSNAPDTAASYLYNESGNTWSTVTSYPTVRCMMPGAHIPTGSTGISTDRYYFQQGWTSGGGQDAASYSYSRVANTWRTETDAPYADAYANFGWTGSQVASTNYLYQTGGTAGKRTIYYAQVI